jgi:hypothetical protein
MKDQGISEHDIDNLDLNSKDKIILLKNNLRVKFPMLLTNILKIILFKGEDKLACVLTAFYEIALEEDMIFRAIEHSQYSWL